MFYGFKEPEVFPQSPSAFAERFGIFLLPVQYYGSRVGGGKPRSWAKAQFCPARPSLSSSRRGVEGTMCSSIAHGPLLLLLLDSDSQRLPLQNEGVRVSCFFPLNIHIRLQI